MDYSIQLRNVDEELWACETCHRKPNRASSVEQFIIHIKEDKVICTRCIDKKNEPTFCKPLGNKRSEQDDQRIESLKITLEDMKKKVARMQGKKEKVMENDRRRVSQSQRNYTVSQLEKTLADLKLERREHESVSEDLRKLNKMIIEKLSEQKEMTEKLRNEMNEKMAEKTKKIEVQSKKIKDLKRQMEQINQRVEEYIASSQEEEVLERDRRAAETPEEYIPIRRETDNSPIGPEYIPTRTSQIQTPRGVWGSFSRELGTRERPISGYGRGGNSHREEM